MKRILFSLLWIVYIPFANAQTTGFTLSLEQEVEVMMSGRSAMKNKVLFYINDTKAKSQSEQQGMKMNVFYFDSTKAMYTVVNIGGQKQVMVQKEAILSVNKKYKSMEVRYQDELKEIVGTICKKAILILEANSEKEEKVIWYDPDIVLPFKYNFGVPGLELIKGLPMEYENSQMGLLMKHSVIKKELNSSIAPDIFNMEK
ncbi:MAG: hypothetical protein KA143_01190 [Saprospiraceae bacterium]|nr:hypothetical protein [Saprospiraceae bacterium]